MRAGAVAGRLRGVLVGSARPFARAGVVSSIDEQCVDKGCAYLPLITEAYRRLVEPLPLGDRQLPVWCCRSAGEVERRQMAGCGFTRETAVLPSNSTDSFLAMRSS